MSRFGGWWDLGERACRALTEPHVNAGAADGAVLALLRDSCIGSACLAFTSRVNAAWIDSRCRRLLRPADGRA